MNSQASILDSFENHIDEKLKEKKILETSFKNKSLYSFQQIMIIAHDEFYENINNYMIN